MTEQRQEPAAFDRAAATLHFPAEARVRPRSRSALPPDPGGMRKLVVPLPVASPMLSSGPNGRPLLPHFAYDDEGFPYEEPRIVSQNWLHEEELNQLVAMLRAWLEGHHADAKLLSDSNFFWHANDHDRRVAPDVLLTLRLLENNGKSYKLSEQQLPDLVMEMLSPGTAAKDLEDKRELYRELGIREYWVLDPGRLRFDEGIVGFRLKGKRFDRIRPLAGTNQHPCTVLPLHFRMDNDHLVVHDRTTGKDLERHGDLLARADAEEARADAEKARAQAADARADEAERQCEDQRRRADAAQEEIARLQRELLDARRR